MTERELLRYYASIGIISIDDLIVLGKEGKALRDFAKTQYDADKRAAMGADATSNALLAEALKEILDTLTEREADVLRMRFGMYDGRTHTLEEVGQIFGVTRERIRQIEKKATTAENSGSSVKISPMWMAEVYFCCTAVTVKAMPVQKTDRNRALLQPVAVWGRQGVSNKTDSSSITVPVTNC